MSFLVRDAVVYFGLIFGIVFHEVAHAYVAYRFGDLTPKFNKRLSFNPLRHLDILGTLAFFIFRIGWAKPVLIDERYLRTRHALAVPAVILAGPLVNLFVSIVFGYAALVLDQQLLVLIALINFYLAFFNLLPFPPLDGGRLVVYVLDYFRISPRVASFLEKYGIWLLVIFLALGFWTRLSTLIMGLWGRIVTLLFSPILH